MGQEIRENEPARRNGDSAQDEPSEFQRFEDLARKLTQVPKTELDEKRKASKA